MLTTLIAFILALAILIAVHEWGHYRMAVACGVKVIRFSIGFGKTIARFTPKNQKNGQNTEFVIAMLPFGGYVKMLDEREGEVSPQEKHLAFNNQPLKSRALIVAAGPVANLILAIIIYTIVNLIGIQEPKAIITAPAANTIAANAGLKGGELITAAIEQNSQTEQKIHSFETLRWVITEAAINGKDLTLLYKTNPEKEQSQAPQTAYLPLSQLQTKDPSEGMFEKIGITSPQSKALIRKTIEGGAAQTAGLKEGDTVLKVDNTPITSSRQLITLIRSSNQNKAQTWEINRAGQTTQIQITPKATEQNGEKIGLVGAHIGEPPQMTLVQKNPIEAVTTAAQRVWDISLLSLKLLGQMATGQLSLKNLSGPIAIADYAGKSAELGLTYYLSFLAFISVSLGVLNLLPVPVLDGGHLMYYLWEAVTGKPVKGAWLQNLQYIGMFLLLSMMAIAVFNDITQRLI